MGPNAIGVGHLSVPGGKPGADLHDAQRQAQVQRAGPASAAVRLDPPQTESLRAIIEAQAKQEIVATGDGREEPTGAQNQTDARGLSKEEQSVVEQLKARDREVRDHEQAHASVGGEYAGQPSYTYQTGPDGNRYAVGGEVAIDIAPVEGDPEATVQKMEVVKAAALAPAEPSSQDRKVAALADAQRNQALADLAALRSAVNTGLEEPSLNMVA